MRLLLITSSITLTELLLALDRGCIEFEDRARDTRCEDGKRAGLTAREVELVCG